MQKILAQDSIRLELAVHPSAISIYKNWHFDTSMPCLAENNFRLSSETSQNIGYNLWKEFDLKNWDYFKSRYSQQLKRYTTTDDLTSTINHPPLFKLCMDFWRSGTSTLIHEQSLTNFVEQTTKVEDKVGENLPRPAFWTSSKMSKLKSAAAMTNNMFWIQF